MNIHVRFYSYFKEITGCPHVIETIAEGSTLRDLIDHLSAHFPGFASMRKSMLVAVGVEYQDGNYQLKEGDEVSLFPPVQGG